jgi:hypothetical protein
MYGVTNCLIANNTLIDQGSTPSVYPWIGVFASRTGKPSVNVIVRNNIANMFNLSHVGVTDDHNLSLSSKNNWSGSTGEIVVLDPTKVFVTYIPSQAKFDLRLATGSPAIGAGNPLSEPKFDILGNVRTTADDGAYAAFSHAPTGISKTVTTPQNVPYVFAASDFGFSDSNDSGPNTFTAIKITTLPGVGTLTDNGIAVKAGQFVSIADITKGKFVFTARNGPANYLFTFQVQDSGSTANGGANLDPTPKTMLIIVTPS